MAVTVVAGLAAAGGAFVATIGTTVAFGLVQFATAFAIGAGLSLVSRALAPKPSLGSQLQGITQTRREPAGTRKLVYGRIRVGGQVVFISHSGEDNKYLHLAIVFASHEIESYDEIWFNDKRIWTSTNNFTGEWGTYVTMEQFTGTDTQTASTQLKNANSRWTDSHKLQGMAYIAFRLEWDADQFPQGVPNITAVIKGKKVYDPRDSGQSISDSSTWEYSYNPALCIRDYLVDKKYGLGEDPAMIDSTTLSSAANYCDATQSGGVDIYPITGRRRFGCHGVVDTGNSIKNNIEQILASMGGRLTFSGGKYYIDPARYVAPTLSFAEADLIGEIQVQTKQSRRSVYNGVKGIYVAKEKDYKVVEYPAQISSTYQTQDGDPIYLDLPLPFVSNKDHAQALAKIALLKSRQQTTLTMTVNLKGLKVKVGDVINVSNTRLGYSSKKFEVLNYQLINTAGGQIGVELSLLETASSVYDWTSSDSSDLTAGELPLYDGRTVDNVTSLTLTEIGLRGPDGGINSSVELTWTAPTDAFIDYYTIRYNKNGQTDYFEVQSREARVLISNLDITSNYDFRVKAVNLIGVSSSGTSLTNQVLNGDQTDPSAPSAVTTTGGIQTITCEWTNPSDIDYAHTEVHVVDTNTTPSLSATPTARITGEEYVVTGLSGAVTKYFFLRAVDYSGNKSVYTAGVSGTSVALTQDDVGDGEIEGRTIALLLNSLADGTYNSGEASLVACNLDGTPIDNTDGFVLYDGEQITIENDQYVNSSGNQTVLTSFIGKNGFIGFDVNKTKPFQMGSGSQGSFGDIDCAFVWTEDDKWYYDPNDYNSGAANLIQDVTYKIHVVGTTDFTVFGAADNNVGTIFTASRDGTSSDGTGRALRQSWPEFDPNNFTGTANGAHYKTGATTTTAKIVALGQLRLDEVTGDTIVAGGLYADPMDITATEIPDNVITGRTIVVESITANKISGDISEVYSFGVQRTPLTLTSSEQTFATFDIPAPDADLTKYASLNATMQYTSNSPTTAYAIEVDFERKSKGETTGVSIGDVVGSGTTSLIRLAVLPVAQLAQQTLKKSTRLSTYFQPIEHGYITLTQPLDTRLARCTTTLTSGRVQALGYLMRHHRAGTQHRRSVALTSYR
jgi:hypothetical protein